MVMPFSLKNVGATYMRAMTTLFYDMIHKEIEVYMDDIIIKSRKSADHLKDLRKFFERLRRYSLKLNPAKCAFGVLAGKLLGFIISKQGIDMDPSMIKAIQDLPPPNINKYVIIFLGRLNYIAHSAVICEPIFKLLKKDVATKGTEECQKAFDRIKEYLSSPPVLVPPEPGKPLLLYLFVLDNEFGCMLGQHNETTKKEQAIYYLSKKFTPYEARYTLLERTCFALIWITQKLRHYLSKAIKGQSLADHFAENPVDKDYKPLTIYFPDEEHPDKNYIDLIEIEVRDQHAYCFHVDEEPDGKTWYRDIKRFLEARYYPESASKGQKQALRRLANHVFLNREVLYRRTPDLGLLMCVDIAEATRILEEIHARTCGSHMNGFTLANKILTTEYFWMTMESDSIRYGMDMIGPIESSTSNGLRFILVAIDYFTKWVKASTYKVVTKKVVADFVRNNIVCRFGILWSIITGNASNLNSDLMMDICEKLIIIQCNSISYRP
uniref:Reverse transcriptase domain-containing protein n=1 Tax=Nicotiana tabacum TaxID=4097 RepID=A0A1S4CR00_TOBAC|nr:PREDICTED: uncharacterized protein LOC107821616 [Nicotiana tabacum]